MQANIIPFLLYALHLRPTRARTLTHGALDVYPSWSRVRGWRFVTRPAISVDQPSQWRPRVTPGYFVWTRTRRRRPAERDGASHGHAEARSPRAKGHRTDALGHRARAGGRPRTCLPLRTRDVLERETLTQNIVNTIQNLHLQIYFIKIISSS